MSNYNPYVTKDRVKNPLGVTDAARVGAVAAAPAVNQTDPRIAQKATTPRGAVIPTSAKTGATPASDTDSSGAGNGTGSGVSGYYDRMVSLYERQMADEKARQEKVKKARIDAANKVYDTSLANLNDARDSSLRQAYIKHMQEQKALPQQMQAYGISGGATETSLANLKNAYGTNRTGIMNEAMEQQRYIEQDRANAIANAEADAANYEASAVREYNDGLLNLYASALKGNYSTGDTGNIRKNPWYDVAVGYLEDGETATGVITRLREQGVSEDIIDAIMYNWESTI